MSTTPTSTHASVEDARNASIKIYVNGELLPREQARVSVYDSGFLLGDGVWEGLRLHNGRFLFEDRHVKRLFQAAKALSLDIGKTPRQVSELLAQTVAANDMHSGVHLRLMVTRGIKRSPYQDPRLSDRGPTIVVIPEYREADPGLIEHGIRMFTVHVPRGAPTVQDPKLNSHSKLNCVTAMIQAYTAGFDEALMLDPLGFVNTGNSVNFFVVRDGEVWTSTGDYCMPGITRGNVIDICRENGIPVFLKNYSLLETYSADEAFVTGTFGGPVPVVEIDGRRIGSGRPGALFQRIRELYVALIEKECPP